MTRKRRVTLDQLKVLWEFLNSNKNLVTYNNKSVEGRAYSKKKWMVITRILNAHGKDGAMKTCREWCKYWVDYKHKLKKKVVMARLPQNDSQSSAVSEFLQIELKFLQLLGEGFGQKNMDTADNESGSRRKRLPSLYSDSSSDVADNRSDASDLSEPSGPREPSGPLHTTLDYIVTKKRKLPDISINEGSLIVAGLSRNVQSECELFGQLLVEKLKQMREDDRLKVMNEIDNLVFKYKQRQ